MLTHLAKITYKPGWEFAVADASDLWLRGTVTIEFRCLVPHRDDTSRMIHISGSVIVPEYLPDDQFLRWFRHSVITPIELHELDEFFRYDGVRVSDPHKPVTSRNP